MKRKDLTPLLTSFPGRYARALFAVCEARGKTNEILDDLQKVDRFFKSSPELQRMLSGSGLPRKHLAIAWKIVTETLSLSSLFLCFMDVLIQARRISFLPVIHRLLTKIVTDFNNQRELSIHSAYPLQQTEKDHLMDVLSKIFPEKLNPTFEQDPSLLSGLAIQTDNITLDASYKAQVNHITQLFKGN
ncbi:MAG: ATP synthase F1 subunit delta [Alphaproteobacteria bacterium]|nr:ATP synthase F1 subunit delta [Alphaproteobacteria bacterium]